MLILAPQLNDRGQIVHIHICLPSTKLKPHRMYWQLLQHLQMNLLTYLLILNLDDAIKMFNFQKVTQQILTLANMLSNGSNAAGRRFLELLLCKQDIILQYSTTAGAVNLTLLFISLYLCTATVGALACHLNAQRTQ